VFSTNPKVKSKLDDFKGDEIWLSGIIDRDLLLLSTKGIWILWVEWKILKLWRFDNGVRESSINYMND
jgi:hypothetical protein